jgi:hypothetical protein
MEWDANPPAKREMRFFPNFALRELMAWYMALGALGALAAIDSIRSFTLAATSSTSRGSPAANNV